MTNKELILELQQILKDDYGLDLPFSTVAKVGNFLLSYFETLLIIEKNKNKH